MKQRWEFESRTCEELREHAAETAQAMLDAAGELSAQVERTAIEARLLVDFQWKDRLQAVHIFIQFCIDAAAIFESEFISDPRCNDDTLLKAIQKLHAGSSRTAREVHTLLRAGFAEGAFARWTYLFECATLSTALVETGPVGAERYLEWSRMNTLQGILGFNEPACRAGGQGVVSNDELERIEVELLGLRGGWVTRGDLASLDDEVNRYQWLPAAGLPAEDFVGLAKHLGLDRWLADYQVASCRLTPHWCDHASYYGAPKGEGSQLIDGSSAEVDLKHPALLCCVSLFQATVNYLTCRCDAPWDGVLMVPVRVEETLALLYELFAATNERLDAGPVSSAH